MPLEIRELVIKVTIENKPARQQLSAKDLYDLKASIVKECTSQIIHKIKTQSER